MSADDDPDSGNTSSAYELRYVAEVPYLAVDDKRFDFPDGKCGPDIVLHLARAVERRTFDGILGAMDDLWTADVFAAVAGVLDRSPVSVATWTLTGFATEPSAAEIAGALWDRCFSVLDELSFAYRVVTGWGVGEMSPSYIQAPVFYVLLQDGRPTERAGMFATPGPDLDEVLGHDVLPYVAQAVVERFEGIPIVETRRWIERAHNDAAHGFHAMAVIALQTATEVFFGEILQLLHLDAKTWRDAPAPTPIPTSYKELVGQVAHLVGGDWDRTHATPWRDYWEDLYRLRNSVIHAGARPSQAQAEAAFTAQTSMMRWFRDLLLRSPRRFTRTVLAYSGFAALMVSGNATNYLRAQHDYWNQPGRRYWTDEPKG